MKEKQEQIITVLKNFIAYPTIDGQEEEMKNLFSYIKTLVPKEYFIKEYQFEGKPTMVIANTEDTNLDVVFCCHIDVVPNKEYNLKEKDGILYGRGTFDMKGGAVVSLLAFLNQKLEKKVGIFLTSDEEISGNCTKQLLTIYNPRFGIIPDGGNNFDIIQAEKGRFLLRLKVHTKSAHAAQLYDGVNAVTTLMDAYQALIKHYPIPKKESDWRSSVCLTSIKGGNAYNQVPEDAEMILDIRRIPTDDKKTFIDIIKKSNPNIEVEILAQETPYETNIEDSNVQLFLQSMKQVLKKEPVITTANATCDGIYFAEKNIPTVLLNPPGGYPHSKDEFVKKEGLFQLYEIFINYLNNL